MWMILRCTVHTQIDTLSRRLSRNARKVIIISQCNYRLNYFMFFMYGGGFSKRYFIVCVPMRISPLHLFLFQLFWIYFYKTFVFSWYLLTWAQESENKNSFLRWETVPPLTQTRQEERGERWASSSRRREAPMDLVDWWNHREVWAELSCSTNAGAALFPRSFAEGGTMTRIPPLAGC